VKGIVPGIIERIAPSRKAAASTSVDPAPNNTIGSRDFAAITPPSRQLIPPPQKAASGRIAEIAERLPTKPAGARSIAVSFMSKLGPHRN